MRTAVLGALMSAGLVIAAAGSTPNRNEVFAQRLAQPRTASAEGELIALSTTMGEQYQQVTIIDPKSRVLSVYHVDLRSGEVALCSVRNIQWDLQMDNFNTKPPLPQEVRSLLESAGR
jgi:hypothetical protein